MQAGSNFAVRTFGSYRSNKSKEKIRINPEIINAGRPNKRGRGKGKRTNLDTGARGAGHGRLLLVLVLVGGALGRRRLRRKQTLASLPGHLSPQQSLLPAQPQRPSANKQERKRFSIPPT
jgi:hypothetical protein